MTNYGQAPHFVYCGYCGIEVTREIATCCYHQGDCDDDCAAWVEEPYIKEQLEAIPYEDLVMSLYEVYESRDEIDCASKKQNYMRFLFNVCAEYLEEYED